MAERAPIESGMMHWTFRCQLIFNRMRTMMGTASNIQSKMEWRNWRAKATGRALALHL